MFDNITLVDILSAINNNGRRIKRRSCNSNGTRYTMNRIKHGQANATNRKTLDHRRKEASPKAPRKYMFYDGLGWELVEITKKTKNRLKKQPNVKLVECIELTVDTRGYKPNL